jgi:hypothetical protein
VLRLRYVIVVLLVLLVLYLLLMDIRRRLVLTKQEPRDGQGPGALKKTHSQTETYLGSEHAPPKWPNKRIKLRSHNSHDINLGKEDRDADAMEIHDEPIKLAEKVKILKELARRGANQTVLASPLRTISKNKRSHGDNNKDLNHMQRVKSDIWSPFVREKRLRKATAVARRRKATAQPKVRRIRRFGRPIIPWWVRAAKVNTVLHYSGLKYRA